MNLTTILLKLIWSHKEIDGNRILFSTFKLLVRLLKGGNKQIQNRIYDFFISNPNSEKFFKKIYLIFSQEISKTKKEIFGKKTEKNIFFPKLLRLLQLFCEGHNLNLQKYLKNQSNSKKNYDLVTLTVNSLEAFNICSENYESISQCFDTLTEYIQGPCHVNQLAIVNSKFLEYAVEILNVLFGFYILSVK